MSKQTKTARSKRAEQNKKIKKSNAITRALKKTHYPDPIEIKLIDDSPAKQEKLRNARAQAKYLRNHLLERHRETGEWFADMDAATLQEVPVRNPIDGTYDTREIDLLGAHVKDKIQGQLVTDVINLSKKKQKGHKVGTLKFEKQHGSMRLPQYGTDYHFNETFTRVHLTKLGWFSIRGAGALKNRDIIKGTELVWRADGVYLIVTTWLTPEKWREVRAYKRKGVPESVESIDFNVSEPIKDSCGNTFDLRFDIPETIKRDQARLAKQKKGSRSYAKTKERIARGYQKLSYKKDDAANKVASYYMRNDLLLIQDDNLAAWKKTDSAAHGSKKIHDGILGRVKARLVGYGGSVVLERCEPTTRYCPKCGEKTPTPLGEDTFHCDHCGYEAPRNLHAAWNMDVLAGEGGYELPDWFEPLVVDADNAVTLERAIRRSAHSDSGLVVDSMRALHDLLGHEDPPASKRRRSRSKAKSRRGKWASKRAARGKKDKWAKKSRAYKSYAQPARFAAPEEPSCQEQVSSKREHSSGKHDAWRSRRWAMLRAARKKRVEPHIVAREKERVAAREALGSWWSAVSMRARSRAEMAREASGVPFVPDNDILARKRGLLAFLGCPCTCGMRGINAGGVECKS